MDYRLHFTAKIEDYIGSGKVKIVDTLPYKIDESNSNLNGGVYDEDTLTITWEEELPHINTEELKANSNQEESQSDVGQGLNGQEGNNGNIEGQDNNSENNE